MPPDLNVLRTISRDNLSRALRVVKGKKLLIIESKLVRTLDLIANYQFLTDHGVVKVLHLESMSSSGSGPLAPTDQINQILYFISSDLISSKLVCDQINSYLSSGAKWDKIGVVVVPRRLHIITSLFESEGVYGHVTFGQYAYELIPLDEHILSLQFDEIIRELWLDGETSLLPTVAKSIFNLRPLYGEFQHLIALGPYSCSIVSLMAEYELIYKSDLRSKIDSDIPTVIIMDRSLDWVSPLLIPLTYEALLDETFGIRGNTISWEPEVTGRAPGSGPLKHCLKSSDSVFEKIRNLHFSKVVPVLLALSKSMREKKDQGTANVQNLQEFKKFVASDFKKIQEDQKTLRLHLGALDVIIKEKANTIKKHLDLEDCILENLSAKEIFSFFEDSMAKGLEPVTVLRLLALTSLAQDGLRDYRGIKTQFIQSYGFRHIFTLNSLEKMGLLSGAKGLGEGLGRMDPKSAAAATLQVFTGRGAGGSGGSGSGNSGSGGGSGIGANRTSNPNVPNVPFASTLKKLIPPPNIEIDTTNPEHPSYVHNGKYTPLISKLLDEILTSLLLPKSNTLIVTSKLEDLCKSYNISSRKIELKSTSEAYGRGRNVLVFIVGGISRGEIGALQLVGRKNEFNVLCGGTDITNGNKIINAAVGSAGIK